MDRVAHNPPAVPATRLGGRGGISLVFMVSVLMGLALNPGGLLGETSARTENGTPPRQVEQIRYLAETIVRVATKATRHDRHVPIPGVLTLAPSGDRAKSIVWNAIPSCEVESSEPEVREALLNLPPPGAA